MEGAFDINIVKALKSGLVFRPLHETITEVHEWLKMNMIAKDSWKVAYLGNSNKAISMH